MNDFVGTSPWGKIKPDVARKRRGPVIAAVAYVGVKAHEVMPLRKGDMLICDASTRAIKQGVTSAKALKAFNAAGVQIYSHEGLHAKVIASEKFAWIGSANASSNSRDNLTEASIRVEGPACRKAFTWAHSLATEDARLSTGDIRELLQVPVSWQAKGGLPSRPQKSITIPKDTSKIMLIEFTLVAHAYAVKAAEKEKVDVHKILRSSGTKLSYYEQTRKTAISRPVKVDDWLVMVSFGRLQKPCKIIKITKYPKFNIVWYEEIATPVRPRISELYDCVDGLQKGFDFAKVTNKSTISKIRKIYGL
jgi:hypothetical protein